MNKSPHNKSKAPPPKSKAQAAQKTKAIALLRTFYRGVEIVATVLSIVSFLYLIVDLKFQALPTTSSPASDPNDPFLFPFSFTNNSHIFKVYRVSWTCKVGQMNLEDDLNFQGLSVDNPPPKPVDIPAGAAANIDCHNAYRIGGMRINSLKATIVVKYTLSFFHLYEAEREETSTFIWYAQASNPQWVREGA